LLRMKRDDTLTQSLDLAADSRETGDWIIHIYVLPPPVPKIEFRKMQLRKAGITRARMFSWHHSAQSLLDVFQQVRKHKRSKI